MANRRKNNETPVSLFSFQDIITSITGVMVLVVLLIILDIINSNTSKIPPSPFTEDVSNLKQTVENLREELEKEKRWLKENEDLLTKISSTTDLAILPKVVAKEQETTDGLVKTITYLKDNNEQLNSKISSVKTKDQEIKEETTKVIILIDEIKKECEKNEEDIKRKEEEMKALKDKQEEIKKQVIFTLDRAETRKPLFVECSEKTIKVMVVKPRKEIIIIEDKDGNAENLLSRFISWFNSYESGPLDDYIVIPVKPSSSRYVNNLSGFFRKKGFQFALEPLEEDKTAVFE